MHVLVTGGTGKTGRHVVTQLRDQGHRAVVGSRGTSPGPDAVRFDWSEPSTWEPALEGVDAVYVVAPAFVADPEPVVAPFLDRLAERRVVLLSAHGVDDDPTSGLSRLGRRVLERGGAVVQPSWFLQNLSEGLFLPTLQQGFLAIAAGDGRVPFVDTRDVAAVVVAALERGLSGTLHVTGPEALTHEELVAEVASATGRQLSYVDLPPEQMREGLLSAGVPADYADGLLRLCEAIRNGAAATVSDTVRELTGHAPRSAGAFVAEHAGLWKT